MRLKKPKKLNEGDTIATISPCWGIAGAAEAVWKYNIGKKRLEEIGLKVVAAPNSMKGEEYLRNNPKARAEDILWAFENDSVKAIIANIGGNDSLKVLPFLNSETICMNPKIFIGYSDVMNYHLYCYKAGLSTFYGPNLLPIIAETPDFHQYSKFWFHKVLFENKAIGEIPPAKTYSCDNNNYFDKNFAKQYRKETGYIFVQGKGKIEGELFGGHTGIKDFPGINAECFFDKILFIEDTADFFTPRHLTNFLNWLGEIGALQRIKGLLIGKLCGYKSFEKHKKAVLEIVNDKYGLADLAIIANINFGHTSPICIFPYGAKMKIDFDSKKLLITESGVI